MKERPSRARTVNVLQVSKGDVQWSHKLICSLFNESLLPNVLLYFQLCIMLVQVVKVWVINDQVVNILGVEK